MTTAEAELLGALLRAVRRLHFGASDAAYRQPACDVCQLVMRAEQALGPPALAGARQPPARLLPRPGHL